MPAARSAATAALLVATMQRASNPCVFREMVMSSSWTCEAGLSRSPGAGRSVLPLDVLQLDHALPARDLALDERAHFLWAGARRHAAPVGEALAHVGPLANRTDFPVQPSDDRASCSRGDGEAQPGAHFHAGQRL